MINYIHMAVGTQKPNTTTSSSSTLTPVSGVTLISITMFPDGTTQLSWLRLFHHGNISFLVVKALTLMKVNKEPLALTSTVLAILI